MSGKGDKWRKGHNFSKFQSGYDSIDWSPKKKTSSEWLNQDYQGIQIIDPDGWNRENWEHSFYKEKITKEEFEKRLIQSTIIGKLK